MKPGSSCWPRKLCHSKWAGVLLSLSRCAGLCYAHSTVNRLTGFFFYFCCITLSKNLAFFILPSTRSVLDVKKHLFPKVRAILICWVVISIREIGFQYKKVIKSVLDETWTASLLVIKLYLKRIGSK
jgi:hypothetical protein